MASIDWKKQTRQAINSSGYRGHMENEIREKRNHTNKDIDKAKTSENYNIGCDSWGDALKRLNQRNKMVDEVMPPKRVRKDRVWAMTLEYPCPRILTKQ